MMEVNWRIVCDRCKAYALVGSTSVVPDNWMTIRVPVMGTEATTQKHLCVNCAEHFNAFMDKNSLMNRKPLPKR